MGSLTCGFPDKGMKTDQKMLVTGVVKDWDLVLSTKEMLLGTRKQPPLGTDVVVLMPTLMI